MARTRVGFRIVYEKIGYHNELKIELVLALPLYSIRSTPLSPRRPSLRHRCRRPNRTANPAADRRTDVRQSPDDHQARRAGGPVSVAICDHAAHFVRQNRHRPLFLRNALGVQQTPPNQVLNGIALLVTIYVMFPTGLAMYNAAEEVIQTQNPQEMFSGPKRRLYHQCRRQGQGASARLFPAKYSRQTYHELLSARPAQLSRALQNAS